MWAAHCSCSNVTGTDDPVWVGSCRARGGSDHYSSAVDLVSSSVLQALSGRDGHRSCADPVSRSVGGAAVSRRRPWNTSRGRREIPLDLGVATQHPASGIRRSPDVGRGLRRGVGSTGAGSGGERGVVRLFAVLLADRCGERIGEHDGGAGGAANCGQLC